MFKVPQVEGSDWDKHYLKMARLVSERSKDRSTKCGCVLVRGNSIVSTGYNGFPRGTEDYDNEEKHERPEKYYWFEHAERNAIYNAARMGHSTSLCTAFVTGPPCVDCTRGMIQAGIQRVVIPVKHNMADRGVVSEVWLEQAARCEKMMYDACIVYQMVEIDD
jgi:dCMP deaminase